MFCYSLHDNREVRLSLIHQCHVFSNIYEYVCDHHNFRSFIYEVMFSLLLGQAEHPVDFGLNPDFM